MNDAEPSKPKARSFFKKPDWLKNSEAKAESKAAEPEDLFSRSHDTYDQIVAQEERRKRLREERKQKIANEGRESKRRRVSEEKDSAKERIKPRDGSLTTERKASHQDLPSKDGLLARPYPAPADNHNVITLDDSDEDNPKLSDADGVIASYELYGLTPPPSHARSPRKTPQNRKPSYDLEADGLAIDPVSRRRPLDIPDDDDDLDPVLAARARAKARQEQAATASASLNGPSTPTANRSTTTFPPVTPEGPNPVIQVFIQPRIEGTSGLLVKRRYRQRIKECREAWCMRQAGLAAQGLSASDVIFAYRGRRIFDSSTIKSLGIALDAAGEPVFPAPAGDDDDAEDQPAAQIVLVATTQQLLDADRKAEENRRRRAELGEPSEPEDGADEDDEEALRLALEQRARSQGVRIVLKAKGQDDYKLKVNPDTTIERIVAVYKDQKQLPPDAEVAIVFDGDTLDPAMQIKDSEVEDMDSLEVYIK